MRVVCALLTVVSVCFTDRRGCVYAQLADPGLDLNQITTVTNFDVNRFVGRWNELLWVAPEDEIQYDATDFFWTLGNSASHGVINGGYIGRDAYTAQCFSDTLKLTGTASPWNLLLTLGSNGNITLLYVLDTDYDSYANVYGCYDYSNDRQRCYQGRTWLFARGTSVPDSIQQRVLASWQLLHLDIPRLLKTTPWPGNECPIPADLVG